MRAYTKFTVWGLIMIGLAGFGCNSPSGHSHEHQYNKARPGTYPSAYPDRIVVTWEANPATSFSVTWRTDSTVTSTQALIAPASPAPKFYRNADTLSATMTTVHNPEDDAPTANFHSVTFDHLQPDSLYAYRVGYEGHWSEWFQIRTAPKRKNQPFSFIYVGDAQNRIYSHWSRAIRRAYKEEPNARFILHAGDLINNKNRVTEWSAWNQAGGWIQGSIPNIAVPGNHEYLDYSVDNPEPKLSIYWKPQFRFPTNGPEGLEETVYYIDYQNLRIIALNSNVQIEKQTRWLKKVLSSTDQQWIIVTHHHPIYSSGKGRNNPNIREQWQPLYEKYHVNLVLQGHDHTYARGIARNTNRGTNTVDPSSETVYVNSVSGAKMYSLKNSFWKDMGGKMQRSAENTQLYQVIHFTPDTLKFRAYTVTGQLYDAFNLVQKSKKNKTHMIDHTPDVKIRRHDNTIPY